MRLKQPVFDPAVVEKLKPLKVLDNYHGLVSVVTDWLVIVASAVFNIWLTKVHRQLGVVFYPICLLVIGGRIRALACLLHVSTHRALAKSKMLNDFLGSVLSGWCVLQSWTGYHYQHVVLHHPHLGDPDKDPDFQQIIKTGLYSKETTREDVVNYLKSIPLPATTVAYVQYLVTDRVFPKAEKLSETIIRLIFWAFVISVLYFTGNMQSFLFYWIVPMLTTTNWIGLLAEFLEHFPLLVKDVDELHASRNKFCGSVINYFLHPHGDYYHLVHHLFPRIPHWNYKATHDIMMQDENYRAVNKHRPGLPALIDDVLSHFD